MCMHHTRNSGKSSPLVFDPEIERTVKHTKRVLHRENKVIQSPTPKTMETSRTPEKQPETSPQHFSPIPNQPSPNTTLPQPPQSTQSTTTTSVPPFSSFFPNIDNLQQASTQATSFQYPAATHTVNLQQSSPYVRIIPDDNTSPSQTQAPNETSRQQAARPVNSQQSQPLPHPYRPTIYDHGNNSGEFEDGDEEYDDYVGQNERQVVNTGIHEGVNQTNLGCQQYVQPQVQLIPIPQQQYYQPDPINQQPIPRRPVDIPLPPPVPQMPGQARPLP